MDRVRNGIAECPDPDPGDVVDANGCSIAQACPLEGDYDNHGAHVSCAARVAGDCLLQGLIDEATKDAIVSAAAQSDIGNIAQSVE